MARIFGNISPSDDYTHEPGSRENFNESVHFNFCERGSGIGGFVRMGNRPNQGHAEYSVVIYLEGGAVLYLHDQAPITDNARFAAGGMQIDVIQPTERLRTHFKGAVPEIADPRKLVQAPETLRDAPRRELDRPPVNWRKMSPKPLSPPSISLRSMSSGVNPPGACLQAPPPPGCPAASNSLPN